jgi:hypothetical protein
MKTAFFECDGREELSVKENFPNDEAVSLRRALHHNAR